MRYWCVPFVIIIFAVLLGQAIFPAAAEATSPAAKRTLVLATTEYPPFYSENLPNYGVVPDICIQVFQRMGYRVKVKSYPFARAVRLMQEGKVDGFLGLWYREARLGWAHYSKPLLSHQLLLYKRVDMQIDFAGLVSLKPYLIGIGRGYANPQSFVDAKLKTEAASSDIINLRKLYHGRIDLALMSKDVAQYLIRTGPGPYRGMFEPLGESLGREWFHFAATKRLADYRVLVNDFNLGLALLAEEGRLQDILREHGFARHQTLSKD